MSTLQKGRPAFQQAALMFPFGRMADTCPGWQAALKAQEPWSVSRGGSDRKMPPQKRRHAAEVSSL